MNFRLTITLVVLLVLLAAGFFGYETWRDKHPDNTSSEQKLVISPAPTGIKSLEYDSDGQVQVAFAKGADNIWRMTQPVDAPVDEYSVSPVTDDLKDLTYTDKFEPAASGPKSADATGTAKPRQVIKFTDDKGQEHTLFVGKRAVGGVYATLDSAKTIYLLDKDPAEPLDKDPQEFRSKLVKTVQTDDIQKLIVKHRDQTVTLAKSDGKWVITGPITSRANESVVDGIVNELKAIRAAGFTQLKKTNLATGLNPPMVSVTAEVAEKAAATAPATAPATAAATSPATTAVTLELGYYTDPTNKKSVYATLAGSSDVFTLSSDTFSKINQELSDLRDPVVIPGNVSDATDISINQGDTPALVLHRANDDWTMHGGAPAVKDLPGDSATIGTLVSELKNLRASKFSDAAGDLKSIGLEPPQAKIEITLPAQTRHEVLLIGKPEPEKLTPVMLQGEPTVYLVKTDALTGITPDALALRDHAVQRLLSDDIREIAISGGGANGGKPLTLRREGTTWKVVNGTQTEIADDTKITSLLADFTPLNAAKYLAADATVQGSPDVVVQVTSVETPAPTPASQPASQAAQSPATQAASAPATMSAELQAALNKPTAGPQLGKTVNRTLRLWKGSGQGATAWKAVWDGQQPAWTFQPTSQLIEHLTATSYPAATQPASQPATEPVK
ncbi:MAG TPA: DUF4340 domain-containing protein [Phycisphaerae bacterium]|nr:DUF4340 domain-containing protein [Phycisphaerae bacterium]